MVTARELTAEQLASYRAAAGIARRDTLRAIERVHDLSLESPVNLVDLAACSDSLRRVVKQEGQPV